LEGALMAPAVVLKLLVMGLGIGALSGMLGIGGGVLVIPALVMVLGFTQQRAVGTSLAMLLPPIGLFAVLRYQRAGSVDWAVAMVMAAAFTVGALGGGAGDGGGCGGALAPLGGIYFALDAPDDFMQLQAPILGVVSMISVLLHRKLGGQAEALRGRIEAATLSPPQSNSRSAVGHMERPVLSGSAGAAALASAAAAAPASPAALCVESGAPSFNVQTSSLSFTSKRLNTDAIMKVAGSLGAGPRGWARLPLV
jgi:uncharacterized membrane protein YfcA